MSTEYIPRQRVPFDQIVNLDIKIGDLRIRSINHDDVEEGQDACLTDGKSFLWAFLIGDNGTTFERYGLQPSLGNIITALETHFSVEIISDEELEAEEEDDDADRDDPEGVEGAEDAAVDGDDV